jgi:hypothetical protein|tara:strand:+ start:72 stop:269 length:198 start_codon:yes stop_codon:yes gene_type:complete
MRQANGLFLSVHRGNDRVCKTCEREQYLFCWDFSNDYKEYIEEGGALSPDMWNERNIELEQESNE